MQESYQLLVIEFQNGANKVIFDFTEIVNDGKLRRGTSCQAVKFIPQFFQHKQISKCFHS